MPYIGKQLVRGQNRKLDDISSGFNGSLATFTLQVASQNVTVGSALQLWISLGGVVQEPLTDYTVAGNQITFTTAPAASLDFFGVIQGDVTDTNTPGDATVTTSKLSTGLTVNLADGSAATSSLQLGGTDSGLFSSAADRVNVTTGGVERLEIGDSEVVFNDPSNDVDFRVESNGETHMLFVDAGNDRVGIGTSSPDRVFEIQNSAPIIRLTESAGTYSEISGSTSVLSLRADEGAGVASTRIDFRVDGSEVMRIDDSGDVGLGTTSPTFTHGGGIEIHRSGAATLRLERTGATASALEITAENAITRLDTRTNSPMAFHTNTNEQMRIDSSGRMLLGVSTSVNVANLAGDLQVHDDTSVISAAGFANSGTSCGYLTLGKSRSTTVGTPGTVVQSGDVLGEIRFAGDDGIDLVHQGARISAQVDGTPGSNVMPGRLVFSTTADGDATPTEQMRITNDGRVYADSGATAGFIAGNTTFFSVGSSSETGNCIRAGNEAAVFVRSGGTALHVGRQTSDGTIVGFRQGGTEEGTISVSGTTVSYNGGHLSRWSQLAGGVERTEILRGSVLSNLDEMCEWGEEDNEQLNRMKVSDVEGDVNVSGVFQAWDDDDDTYTNDFYCAMTGDFVIRIAQGTTVARGDLLMSAGDGTAKPQDDDIVRSKTIAKVTSTTVSTTYADGSYCVPCVLMAC